MAQDDHVPRLGQAPAEAPDPPKPAKPPPPAAPHQHTGWLILVTVCGCIGLLSTPSLYNTALPAGDELIGRPAERNIKASADFNIEDPDTTAAKRDEAAANVPPVFIHDQSIMIQQVERVRAAFTGIRGALEPLRQAFIEQARAATPTPESTPDTKATAKKHPAPVPPPPGPAWLHDPGIRETLAARRPEFERQLQIKIEAPDWEFLDSAAYSEDFEEALLRLLTGAMKGPVAAGPQVLEAVTTHGMSAQRYLGARLIEEAVIPAGTAVADVARAREAMAAQIPQLAPGIIAPADRVALRLASQLVVPNLTFNKIETEKRKLAAWSSVTPFVIPIKAGDMIIREGERYTPRHLLLLRGIKQARSETNKLFTFLGSSLFAAFIILVTFVFAAQNIRKFRREPRDLAFQGLSLVATLALAQIFASAGNVLSDRLPAMTPAFFLYLTPVVAAPMLLRIMLNSESAILYTIIQSLFLGFVLQNSLVAAAYSLAGGVVAANAVGRVTQRFDILKAGVFAGLANVGTILCAAAIQGKLDGDQMLYNMGAGLAAGIASSMLVFTAAPIIEILFGYTTDIQLLELASMNHPCLKELVLKAPGSYHHSIIVGTLAEAGAEAIGANPLLARVMAYYHDIGKVKNPEYFAENQNGINRHDRLSPSMSTLIIKAHVKDGLELAKTHKLGQPIQDAIIMHHGTTLIRYFYHKAQEAWREGDPPVREIDFRYPGIKPQYREAALVMIADACEAAARAMANPTEDRLKGLIQKIINKLFTDGQFDECDLTLRDLHVIAKAYHRTLAGMYHQRPEYPESGVKVSRRPGGVTPTPKSLPVSTTLPIGQRMGDFDDLVVDAIITDVPITAGNKRRPVSGERTILDSGPGSDPETPPAAESKGDGPAPRPKTPASTDVN